MHKSDEHICKLLQQNDTRGMESLYNKYYRPMVLWADTFLNDLHAAEDLVQDFFIVFWTKDTFKRITSSNLSGYLFSAVRFTALKHLRKRDPLRKSSQIRNLVIELIEPGDLTEEMLQQIEAEIAKLPPRTREVITAVYYDGLRYKEVATKFRISIATVKTLLVNGLKRLRRIFSSSC